ncbi:MAG TPA: ribonuclease H [Minicystis sp.]|nr:ribonuclease H [Minicystis sp.]
MPWVRAVLRGQRVYARANEDGTLAAKQGRVEIRYKPNDGRRYDARVDNLAVEPGAPLPDDTCGPADAVQKGAEKDAAGARTAKGAAPAPRVPEGAVIAYADGACSGNPGPAGLGVVVIDGPERVELSEYLGTGTNNIAELTAILRALEIIAPERAAVIHTDSQYSIGVLQKGWKAKANQELVAAVRAALSGRPSTRLAYVPGHAGVILNERADALAREAVSSRTTRRETLTSKRPATPPTSG